MRSTRWKFSRNASIFNVFILRLSKPTKVRLQGQIRPRRGLVIMQMIPLGGLWIKNHSCWVQNNRTQRSVLIRLSALLSSWCGLLWNRSLARMGPSCQLAALIINYVRLITWLCKALKLSSEDTTIKFVLSETKKTKRWKCTATSANILLFWWEWFIASNCRSSDEMRMNHRLAQIWPKGFTGESCDICCLR